TEAMHVMRADNGFIIVGQDTDGSVTPLDLGMDGLLSKNKDFLGKRSLARSDMSRSSRRQLVGLLTEQPEEVLPEGAQLVDNAGREPPVPMVGFVTSSYHSARVGRSIALALVNGGHKRLNESVYAPLVDGRIIKAKIVKPVFYEARGSN